VTIRQDEELAFEYCERKCRAFNLFLIVFQGTFFCRYVHYRRNFRQCNNPVSIHAETGFLVFMFRPVVQKSGRALVPRDQKHGMRHQDLQLRSTT